MEEEEWTIVGSRALKTPRNELPQLLERLKIEEKEAEKEEAGRGEERSRTHATTASGRGRGRGLLPWKPVVSIATNDEEGVQGKIGAPIILTSGWGGGRGRGRGRGRGQQTSQTSFTGGLTGLAGSSDYEFTEETTSERRGGGGEVGEEGGGGGDGSEYLEAAQKTRGILDLPKVKVKERARGDERKDAAHTQEVAMDTRQSGTRSQLDLSSDQQWPSIASGATESGGRGQGVWSSVERRNWSMVAMENTTMKHTSMKVSVKEEEGEEGEEGDFASVKQKKKRKKKAASSTAPPPLPTEKKTKQPIALDIFERMHFQPLRPVLHHRDIPNKKQQAPASGNVLDSTAPTQRRGKEREAAKKKKNSALRKVILKEKEVKKQMREKGMDIPSDLDVTKLSDDQSKLGVELELTTPPPTLPSSQTTTPPPTLPPSQTTTPTPTLPSSHNTPTSQIHSRRFRQYCSHMVTTDINTLTEKLLSDLSRFQDRQYQRDPIRSKLRRRFVCGLREVLKHLKLGRLKCIVMAPNLDHIQSSGGINDLAAAIITTCVERSIPVVFALSRRRLAYLLKKTFKIGCVGIFSYDGAEVHYKKLMGLVEEATQQYIRKTSPHDPQLEGGQKILTSRDPLAPQGTAYDSSSEDSGSLSDGSDVEPKHENETPLVDLLTSPWKVFFPSGTITDDVIGKTDDVITNRTCNVVNKCDDVISEQSQGNSHNTSACTTFGMESGHQASPTSSWVWNVDAPVFQPSLSAPPPPH